MGHGALPWDLTHIPGQPKIGWYVCGQARESYPPDRAHSSGG